MKNYVNRQVKVVNVESKTLGTIDVSLVDEHDLTLFVNCKKEKHFICLNEDLDKIVIGWLIGKNFINSIDEINKIEFKNNDEEVHVQINNNPAMDHNDFDIDKITFKDEWVFDLVNEFLQGTKIHKHTSGTHCCILSIRGKIVLKYEDIGRHNAIDKVIGYIYSKNINTNDCMIFTSGRISSDLVDKVINAKIPILISKSVTSYQAANLAKGKLRLICKAWPDSFEIYS